jgi:hypothetical protein
LYKRTIGTSKFQLENPKSMSIDGNEIYVLDTLQSYNYDDILKIFNKKNGSHIKSIVYWTCNCIHMKNTMDLTYKSKYSLFTHPGDSYCYKMCYTRGCPSNIFVSDNEIFVLERNNKKINIIDKFTYKHIKSFNYCKNEGSSALDNSQLIIHGSEIYIYDSMLHGRHKLQIWQRTII